MLVKQTKQRIKPYESCYRAFVYSVLKRGKYSLSITYEDFLSLISAGKCFYCDIPLTWIEYRALGYGRDYSYKLDRLDNTKGYSVDNVVVCCKFCNRGKSTQTSDQFYTWISRLYHNLKKRNLCQ